MPSQISYAEGMMSTPPLNAELQRLQAHLSQRDDVMLAIAFGSVASGRARFDSDLTADFLPLRHRILKERRERWMQRQRALRHEQPKLK